MSTAPEVIREANGCFGKGNPGGPGNPFGRRLAANRSAILNAIGPEEVEALMVSLMEQAMGGDIAAAKLILQYAVGKPQAVKEPDLIDVDEFQVAKAKRVPHAQAVIALLDMPVEKATEMAGQSPKGKYSAEEERLCAEEERAEAAAREAEEKKQAAEARRVAAHLLRTGNWPEDSECAEFERTAPPERVEEFRRFVGQALRDGKMPEESPFVPFGDGRAEVGSEGGAAVCAAS